MKFLVKIKFWFDWGCTFMSVITLTLLIVAASDKLSGWIGISSRMFIGCAVIGGLSGLVLLGFIMDITGFIRHYQTEQNRRNEMLTEISKK